MCLAADVPGLDVHWSGALVWGDAFGTAAHRDPRATAHESRLISPPESAEFRSEDGWLDPSAATERLIASAQDHGATVRLGTPVTRLLGSAGDAVDGIELGSDILPASTVVVAAGTGKTALCATVGEHVPMVASLAIMVRLRAAAGIVRGIVANDVFEARQDAAGTVLMPFDYDGESSTEALAAVGEEARSLFTTHFHGADDAALLSIDVGWRPMTATGTPIVGHCTTPGLYVAVAHPGITLASVVGDAAADEIQTGNPRAELRPYRL